jgi:acyl carrier protein
VFTEVPAADIPLASQATVESWDSVGTITLINVIEEEFHIEMDFDAIGDLDSFDRVLDYVNGRMAETAAS